VPDGRLVQGTRSRKAVLRRAVDVASCEGLDGLSFRRLAADLEVSKSGVQALFGSMEALQIAAIKTARATFEHAVVAPAATEPAGLARLRALVEGWIWYRAASRRRRGRRHRAPGRRPGAQLSCRYARSTAWTAKSPK
jgi:AcrR family transcriptional regulator